MSPGAPVYDMVWVGRIKVSGKYKSRICVRDFANAKRSDVFAVTPALLSGRLIKYLTVQRGYKRCSLDVTAAFLHTDNDREAYARVPESTLWLIAKASHGQRRAPHLWQEYAAHILQKEVGTR
eukprot:1021575-Alexandrium_andersonii.AAC.1